MNWRTKLVLAAWLIVAIATPFLVRNLKLGGWKDLPIVLQLELPSVVLLISSSCLLLRGARRKSK